MRIPKPPNWLAHLCGFVNGLNMLLHHPNEIWFWVGAAGVAVYLWWAVEQKQLSSIWHFFVAVFKELLFWVLFFGSFWLITFIASGGLTQ